MKGTRAFEHDVRETTAQIHRIIDAIAEGTDTADMRLRLKELDARKTELAAKIAACAASDVIELHPNLPKIYRRKVADLQAALNKDPISRAEAAECLRTLIEKIVVVPGEKRGETTVELHGHVPAILAFAAGPKRAESRSVISLVAAEGFEPPTKGL